MKRLHFFLLMLFVINSVVGMDTLKHTSFPCVGPDGITKIGEHIAVGCDDKIVLYDVAGNQFKAINAPNAKGFGGQLIGHNEQLLVPCGDSSRVYLLNLPYGQVIREFSTDPATPTGDESMTIGLGANRKLICSKPSPLQNQTFFFDIDSGKQEQHWPYVFDCLDELGSLGVRLDYDFKKARSSYAETNKPMTTFDLKKTFYTYPVSTTPNGKYLLVMQVKNINENDQVQYYEVYDTESGKLVKTLPEEKPSFPMWYFSPDGKYFIEATLQTLVNIFDLETGKLVKTLEKEKGYMVNDLWMSEDNQEIVMASFPLPDQTSVHPKDIEGINAKIKRLTALAHLAKQKRAETMSDQTGKIDIWQNLRLNTAAIKSLLSMLPVFV